MTSITIALSKGRIFDETAPLLKAAGIVALDDPEKSRKLILKTNHSNVWLIIVRASDVPTYVQYGAADIGIAGKDVLLEHDGTELYQPLDLNDSTFLDSLEIASYSKVGYLSIEKVVCPVLLSS